MAEEAATTAESTTAATTTAATTEPVAFDWSQQGLDPGAMATVQTKGWKAPGDLLNSYVNLEKLVGAPPEQIIRLPKDMTPELMGPVYDKLGRPKTPDDYKLPVADGQPGEYAREVSQWMHKAGLSAKQALDLAAANNEYFTKQQAAAKTAYEAKVQEETNALKIEWKENHDSNVAVAKRGATTFGVTVEQMSALEKEMGFAAVHKFFYNIGSKLGEAEFVQSGGRANEFTGLSPATAEARLDALLKDRSFSERLVSKDPVVRGEAIAEKSRLARIARPGEVTI